MLPMIRTLALLTFVVAAVAAAPVRADDLPAAGPETVLSIEEFSFDATRQDGGLVATLVKGTLKVVSGLLARRAPESVRFRTPTMVLGVRGTEFIIDTQGAGP